MVINGLKWALLTCVLLQMLRPGGEHVLKKTKKLAPPFLGAGGGAIWCFFGKKRSKILKNDQKWPGMGLERLETVGFDFELVHISLTNIFTHP